MKHIRLGLPPSKNYLMRDAFGNLPPRVQPAGADVNFKLTFIDRHFAKHVKTVVVEYIRDDWRFDNGDAAYYVRGAAKQDRFFQVIPHKFSDGYLQFKIHFEGEHEHTVRISAGTKEDGIHQESIAFYSLEKDLLHYKAFKGNVHSHSSSSDGVKPPEEVPVAMREAAFDFAALTDHRTYKDTFRAVKFAEESGCGIECYPGEEPEGPSYGANHVVSLGAKSCIWDWEQTDKFKRKVAKLKKSYIGLPEREAQVTAETEAVFERIRKEGGISILAHPYWTHAGRFIAMPLQNDFLLRSGKFDALEIGNYETRRMSLLNAKLWELIQSDSFSKPLVGASDWHGAGIWKNDCENPDMPANCYTIIFADKCDFSGFKDAILNKRCVAVGGYMDQIPFGTYRLVKYALFLMENYFRLGHDKLCAKQAKLLRQYFNGDKSVLPEIEKFKKRIDSFRDSFFFSSK